MYKQSPSRNHRSKGIKLKHVLQICLLLAVCFWLIYQVKHSHDKKKEFDENDAKFPIKTESSNEPVKFGRKDLQPRIEGLDTVNEKHKEEPEDETVEDEEGNKPEEEDLEEENKIKEKNVEHTEDGEDEVDDHDHDQEKSDVEVDQEEDIVDEDKERGEDDEKETEERDPEVNDSQVEEENLLEDHDHDEDSSSSHEAREEHYKADDASSAVTHDTVVTTTENDSGKIEKEAEHAAEVTSEVGVNNSMQINTGQNTTADVVKADGEGSPPNTTNSEEKHGDPISFTATDASVSNSTITEGLTDNSGSRTHSTEVSTQMHEISLQNGTQAVTQEYNATLEDTTSGGSSLSISSSQQSSSATDMGDNQLVSNLSFSSKNDGVDSTPLDSLDVSGDTESSLAEKVNQGNATVKAVDNNVTEAEKTDTSDENGTTDEGEDASIAENMEEVQDDPIDTSDSSTHLEEKHIRTDLETLPEIQTEGNMEDAAAE
ncbi:uncharacterized protein LOC107798684 [Nicotiana tabacum]|uniref:Dentin sialophosphoprotein n=1 Tax=Nicotiana tabacum TaxID=4097 RepID=A0A1S4AKG8_TOBAC|nr:PREDICTED: dentin sialophosphoprotein-like [Nicotiana tabacum]